MLFLTNTIRRCGYRYPDRRSEAHRQLRYLLLAQSLNDKSLLRLAMDDNKNNHRAETELGLRLIGQPFGLGPA
jgi:hypothetical protein